MEALLKSTNTPQYVTMEDDTVVDLAQKGDKDAVQYLILKYKSVVHMKTRSYFLMGGDPEDIIQEGMIGLYKAIRDYRTHREASFRSFAELCITRQIITAVKAATRQKHGPLNHYISLNKSYNDDEGETLLNIVAADSSLDPERIVLKEEDLRWRNIELNNRLSTFEKKVLHYYIAGRSYIEIGVAMEKSPKSVDNALQRIKRKLSHIE